MQGFDNFFLKLTCDHVNFNPSSTLILVVAELLYICECWFLVLFSRFIYMYKCYFLKQEIKNDIFKIWNLCLVFTAQILNSR